MLAGSAWLMSKNHQQVEYLRRAETGFSETLTLLAASRPHYWPISSRRIEKVPNAEIDVRGETT